MNAQLQSQKDDSIEQKESVKQIYPGGDKKEYRKSLGYGLISLILTLAFWGSIIYLIVS